MTVQAAKIKKKKKKVKTLKIGGSKNLRFIYWARKQVVNNVKTKELDEKTGELVDVTLNNQRVTEIILEGGSRSTKTFSICQYLAEYVIKNKGKRITIYRDTFSNLKDTVYETLKEVWGLYGLDTSVFNKSATPININGNTIKFKGVLDLMKAHGKESDISWLNEIMGIPRYSYFQIKQRTKELMFIDYNPSLPIHFVYNLKLGKQTAFLKTTMLDNPFLGTNERQQLLSYEPTTENIRLGLADQFMYDVYCLGKRGAGKQLVYPRWFEFKYSEIPKERIRYKSYALDFGWTRDPHCLTEIICVKGENGEKDRKYYTTLIYETDLSLGQLGDKIVSLKLDKVFNGIKTVIICDNNDTLLRDLVYRGLNCRSAKKPQIAYGIPKVRDYEIYINEQSTKAQSEIVQYMYAKDREGGITDYIEKKTGYDQKDHFLDCIRYEAVYFTR